MWRYGFRRLPLSYEPLYRALGRSYGVVGGIALAAVLVAAALVLAT